MKIGWRTAWLLVPVLVATSSQVAPAQYGDWKFDGFPDPSPAVSTSGEPGGWYGGDAAYMVPLDANTMLWTFADVCIGARPRPGLRNRSAVCTGLSVGNTIAIVKRNPATNAVITTHYFRGSVTADAAGRYANGPYPFFADPSTPARARNLDNGDRLWPRKGFMLGGKLYIFMYLVNTQNNFYTYKQTVIARVENPLDPPPNWVIGYLSLGQNMGKQLTSYFGSEAFYNESADSKENYLYVYGTYCDDLAHFFHKFQVLGLRIPLDKFKAAPPGTDLGAITEVMAKKYGTWKPWPVDPADFYEIGNAKNLAYQSLTTRYNKTLGAWQATFSFDKDIEDNKFGGTDIKTRSVWVSKGAGPFGPWEKPMLAYTFPEASLPTPTPGATAPPPGQLPTDPATFPGRHVGGVYVGKLFGYFAKEVPELESSDEVLSLTYSTDTSRTDIDRWWNFDVYTVKFVKSIPNPLLRPNQPAEPR